MQKTTRNILITFLILVLLIPLILAALPTHDNPTLSATTVANSADDNLTVTFNNVNDGDGDPVYNITDWRKDGSSINLLNLPFETNRTGESGKVIRDYSDNNYNASLEYNPTWNDTGCLIGGCYLLDGSQDVINISDSNDWSFQGNFTLEVWMKNIVTSQNKGTRMEVFSQFETGGNDQAWSIYYNTDNTIRFHGKDSGGTDHILITSSNTITSTDDWQHIALVRGGNTATLYINGTSVGTDTSAGSAIYQSTKNVLLGGKYNIGSPLDSFFEGYIDEAKIYNFAVTQDQLIKNYEEGLKGIHVETIIHNETALGEEWQVSVTPNDLTGDGITKLSNTITIGQGGPPVLNSTDNTNTSNENLTIYPQASSLSGNIYNITDWRVNGTSIATLNFPLDVNRTGDSGEAIRDYSSYQLNGTLVTAPTYSENCIVGGCYLFDADNDYINVSDSDNWFFSDNDFTMTLWINPNDLTGENFLLTQTDSGNVDAWNVLMDGTNLRFRGRDSSVQNIDFSAASGITVGNWNFITVRRDSNRFLFYVNGSLLLNQSETDVLVNQNEPLVIGGDRHNAGRQYEGYIDEVKIFNFSLSDSQIDQLYNDGVAGIHTETILSEETSDGNVWEVSVTPNNGVDEDTTQLTNNLTIGAAAPAAGIITITLNENFSRDSSNVRIDDFITSNLDEIETVAINFSVVSENPIDDFYFNFTANGTNACSLGNIQDSTCIIYPTWVQFKNNTKTINFDSTQNIQGDNVMVDVTGNSTHKTFFFTIDEHYNPNVLKHYSALFNYSDVKWQDANDQQIHQDNMFRMHIDHPNIPINADQYKLDFRVNYTTGISEPTQPLNAYICNSSYTTGDPSVTSGCILIAQKLPSELQDDGTKFRGIFTQTQIQQLGDLSDVVLTTDENNPNRYYFIKTLGITNSTYTQEWEYSTNSGSTWNNLADGYESELNLNWFNDGPQPTDFVFGLYINDTSGSSQFLENKMTWDIDATVNYPPVISIIEPADEDSIFYPIDISWTTNDPNNDPLNISILLLETDGSLNKIIIANLTQLNTTYTWNDTIQGNFSLAVLAAEVNTTDLFVSNETISIEITNFTGAVNDTNVTGAGELGDVSLPITLGMIMMIILFLFVIVIANPLMIKLWAFVTSLGFAWVLYALMLEFAESASLSSGIITVLTAGYRLLVFTNVIIYILIFVWLLFKLFTIAREVVKR